MKYIEEQMKLTQEKDALVRKQDYFNVIGDLNETTEKIGIVQQKLSHFAVHDGRLFLKCDILKRFRRQNRGGENGDRQPYERAKGVDRPEKQPYGRAYGERRRVCYRPN